MPPPTTTKKCVTRNCVKAASYITKQKQTNKRPPPLVSCPPPLPPKPTTNTQRALDLGYQYPALAFTHSPCCFLVNQLQQHLSCLPLANCCCCCCSLLTAAAACLTPAASTAPMGCPEHCLSCCCCFSCSCWHGHPMCCPTTSPTAPSYKADAQELPSGPDFSHELQARRSCTCVCMYLLYLLVGCLTGR